MDHCSVAQNTTLTLHARPYIIGNRPTRPNVSIRIISLRQQALTALLNDMRGSEKHRSIEYKYIRKINDRDHKKSDCIPAIDLYDRKIITIRQISPVTIASKFNATDSDQWKGICNRLNTQNKYSDKKHNTRQLNGQSQVLAKKSIRGREPIQDKMD